MKKTWLLAGFSLLLLLVCAAGPACGFQGETPPPPQRPAALTESLSRAFHLIGEGKFQEARAEFERAQTLAAGPCGDCLLGMSHVYAAEKDWKRSKEAALKAIPLLTNPGVLARAYNQLGTAAFLSKGRHSLDEAEGAYRHAVSSGGAWGMLARYNLADVLLTQERWAEAAEAAETYLKDAGPKGTVLDQAHIVLCQARSHLPGDPPVLPGESSKPSSNPSKVEGEVTPPEIIFQKPPTYTEDARAAKIRGTVVIEAIIDREGCVAQAQALKSLPYGLTESAQQAVRTWVFRPATLNGEPVKVYYVLTVNFQIQGRPIVPLPGARP